MSEKNYVTPPAGNGTDLLNQAKEIYRYLHPDYWKRTLVHLLLVIPLCFLLYFSFLTEGRLAVDSFFDFILLLLAVVLTIIAAFFYPFSLYWYRGSFIGNLLNSIYHIGGFVEVILKILATLLGGVLIAGFCSPIFGVLTWRKCVKKNMIIGEAKDFE